MRFANVRELKLETNKVLEMSRQKGPVIITRRGKPVALIRGIKEEDFAQRFDRLWERIRLAAERSGYGHKDVDRLIAEIRARGK